MAETKSMQRAADQITVFWRGLTAQQKWLMGGGVALVAATLWVFVGLLGTPKYATLYSGLRPEEAQAMGSRLAAKNLAYQLSSDGSSVLVPVEKLDASRLETAAQGLPRNARLGFELFDTPNWAGSDFTERVNYQRALEGELERTLQTLHDVETVRVHLVLPRESVFTEQEHEAKAAVIVKTRGGRLPEEAQRGIPQLVASAVDRLRPENVTVVDADSNASLTSPKGAGGGAGTPDEELAQTLVATLGPVVGSDQVRASVHVEYDLSSSENTEETYDPKAAVPLTTQRSEENSGGRSAGGIPGTASNVPGTTAGTTAALAADAESQGSRTETSTYAVSKSVRHIVQPAGRVKRMAAAVLVDDAVEWKDENGKRVASRRKRTAEEMKDLEKLARAAIGVDEQRGDLLAVENLSFQTTPPEAQSAPGRAEKIQNALRPWLGTLRYGGVALLFLVVYGLVLRPVKKQVLTALRELPARIGKSAGPAAAESGLMLEGAGLEALGGGDESRRAALLKRQLTERVQQEPELANRLVQGWIRETR